MLPELGAALEQHDKPGLKRVTHAMMGVAGNYGLTALEAAMRALGNRAPDGLDWQGEMERVAGEIDRAEDAVSHLPASQAA